MSAYRHNMNEAGYYTGRQICNRHPLICELFGWTATELATLGRYDVVKARVTNTAVYLYESDLLELARFIIHQRDKRNKEALNSTPPKKWIAADLQHLKGHHV